VTLAADSIIGIVAGEASGDFLGAELINALRKRFPKLRFVGIGGPNMDAAGFDSWFPMERLAVRGYVEVMRHYAGIVAIRRRLASHMRAIRPSVFIGIDAPDFNLSLEANLKSNGIKTMHYVGPSIWAWRGGRIGKLAHAVDHVLVLFPFEEVLYRSAGIPVSYVGHPLADVIPEADQTAAAREQLRIAPGSSVVALLPGSRQSELHYMASTFIRSAKLIAQRQPGTRFLVPLISRKTRDLFEAALYSEGAQELQLTTLFGHSRDAIAASNAVLVASGTATLEVALYRKPMIISYRMAPATWKIMKCMRYQPWVGLPNIIAGRFLVPELLQDDATPENLSQAVINEMSDPSVRQRLPQHFGAMHALLKRNAAERAADAVLQCIDQR